MEMTKKETSDQKVTGKGEILKETYFIPHPGTARAKSLREGSLSFQKVTSKEKTVKQANSHPMDAAAKEESLSLVSLSYQEETASFIDLKQTSLSYQKDTAKEGHLSEASSSCQKVGENGESIKEAFSPYQKATEEGELLKEPSSFHQQSTPEGGSLTNFSSFHETKAESGFLESISSSYQEGKTEEATQKETFSSYQKVTLEGRPMQEASSYQKVTTVSGTLQLSPSCSEVATEGESQNVSISQESDDTFKSLYFSFSDLEEASEEDETNDSTRSDEYGENTITEPVYKVHGRWCSFKHQVKKTIRSCFCKEKLDIKYIPPYQIDNRIFMQGQVEGEVCRFLFDSDTYYCTTGINVIPKCRGTKLRVSQTSMHLFPKVPIVYMYQGVFNLQIGNHWFQELLLLREYAKDITLGTSFLKNFNVYLDYDTHVIRVEKRSTDVSTTPLCSSCFLQINVIIEETVRKFGLCTGSYLTVVNEQILSPKLRAQVKPLKRNRPGCIGVVEMTFSIADNSMDSHVFVADMEGDGILGADFFSRNRCKLHFENGDLKFYFGDSRECMRYEMGFFSSDGCQVEC